MMTFLSLITADVRWGKLWLNIFLNSALDDGKWRASEHPRNAVNKMFAPSKSRTLIPQRHSP